MNTWPALVRGPRSTRPASAGTRRPEVARLGRLGRCSKSAAIWGTPAVTAASSQRQTVTLCGPDCASQPERMCSPEGATVGGERSGKPTCPPTYSIISSPIARSPGGMSPPHVETKRRGPAPASFGVRSACERTPRGFRSAASSGRQPRRAGSPGRSCACW